MLYIESSEHKFTTMVTESRYASTMSPEALFALYAHLEQVSEDCGIDIDMSDLHAIFSDYSEDRLSDILYDLDAPERDDFECDGEYTEALLEALRDRTSVILVSDPGTQTEVWDLVVLYEAF